MVPEGCYKLQCRTRLFHLLPRTKLICTIDPETCEAEQLEVLAGGGMNVARINMCHGNREWHREVIQRLWRLNEEKGYALAVTRRGEKFTWGILVAPPLPKPRTVKYGLLVFEHSPLHKRTINVNYGSFAEGLVGH
ncbi:unnamed protein product [Fraxinus pennsylvanica]|uniref:pyruvate kinase n=1 Tax=Fraxinus pennsylvanica TaxID=56036 RepID=A0AAD1ZWM9_9LAMI|nr:unnamed protein product [Fraxinus pennsylvanica]